MDRALVWHLESAHVWFFHRRLVGLLNLTILLLTSSVHNLHYSLPQPLNRSACVTSEDAWCTRAGDSEHPVDSSNRDSQFSGKKKKTKFSDGTRQAFAEGQTLEESAAVFCFSGLWEASWATTLSQAETSAISLGSHNTQKGFSSVLSLLFDSGALSCGLGSWSAEKPCERLRR